MATSKRKTTPKGTAARTVPAPAAASAEIHYYCRGPREGRAEAERGNASHPAPGCGSDLTAAIAQVPEDGTEYVVTCPACGTEATITRTPPEA